MADHSERVNQAVEKIREQADCTMEEAFVLMHERATMSGMTMEEIMDSVVAGRIRFGA